MDKNQRLAIVLSMAVVTAWLFWENGRIDERQQQAALEALSQEPAAEQTFAADDPSAAVERPSSAKLDPGVATDKASTPTDLSKSATSTLAVDALVPAWERSFTNSLYQARLTNEGGALTGWSLEGFTNLSDHADPHPIELVAPGIAGVAPLLPMRELGFGDLGRARHVVESEEPNSVVFRLTRGDFTVRKHYTFDPDRYEFELEVEIQNGSNQPIAVDFETIWPSSILTGNDYTEQSIVALHEGDDVEREPLASVGQPGFFSRIFAGGGEDEVWRTVKWAGADLKYFASILIPEDPEDTEVRFEAIDPGVSGASIIKVRPLQIAPGASLSRRYTGYLGPKDPVVLEKMGRELQRSINLGYSWVEPLTLFFQWLLKVCYTVIPNYGLVIIFITILVRVATLPIMNRQMRSMERMRALQPQLKEIQAKFADDRQKQSEATMALYKESGVNPLGGCLPMLLQFPVFIGLFYSLQSSFALRQAPFFGWITDLSAPEALFVVPGIDLPFRLLPVIMGASMVLQQKLTPTTVDPSQQQMMMIIMPIMMTVLFYQFPSGLVLYWMVSNFLGIGHQLLVGRRMKAAAA